MMVLGATTFLGLAILTPTPNAEIAADATTPDVQGARPGA